MDSFRFLGGFQAFTNDVGEVTVSASLSILTTNDGLGCEEQVTDTKACNMADTWTQVVDNL